VLDRATVDRLREADTGGAPVLSVYLDVPADPGDRRGLAARLKALLKPVRDLADGDLLDDEAAAGLKRDLERVLDLGEHPGQIGVASLAAFLCDAAGLDERLDLPGPVRNRAVADRSPYLGPLEAMLSHYRPYCAVVVDRRTASIYRFSMGSLEAWEVIGEEEVRKDNYGGFGGYAERSVRGHAEEVAKRLFRAAADRVAALARAGEFDLLVIGGQQANVDGLAAELPPDVAPRLAGTFAVDPGTAGTAEIGERCAEVALGYEAEAAAAQVAAVMDAAAAGGLAAVGLDPVLEAANQRAISRLVVDAEETVPGVECVECGWLGRRGGLCGYCGEGTLPVPDVIDSIAERVRGGGGEVHYVLTGSDLAEHRVGAVLRFAVPEGV
jgi:peptide chain release factor subunit 1